jgi:RNA polymerase sigma factor (sigma-70 family)
MIDRARAAGHTVPLDDDEIVIEPEPAEDAEWTALRGVAAAYVEALDPDLRRLVALRFEDELSQEETAEALGISRRRVRTLEARIQRGLRKALRRAGVWKKDRPQPALARMGSR